MLQRELSKMTDAASRLAQRVEGLTT